MKTRTHFILAGLISTLLLPQLATAQVPQLVNYQGRVAVGTVNFEGAGSFRFALVNAAGTTTYWGSSADTAPADGVPDTAVALTVTKGLYSVLLGDTSVANMAAIPASVWTNADVRLRVWFNDGVNGNQLLTPDQRIAPTGYIADGSITSAKLAPNLTLAGATSLTGVLDIGPAFRVTNHGGVTGAQNTFIGNSGALTSTGDSNIFIGDSAGTYNETGGSNIAIGVAALDSSISAYRNVALGESALRFNTSSENTAVGVNALGNGSLGGNNIGLGYGAGASLTTGTNNIAIGNYGLAADTGIIRIGTTGLQTDTFLTGIIHGDASAMTNLSGANITAASIGSTQLASGLALGSTTNGTFSGTFSGDGTGLVGLSASSLSGVLPALNAAALTNLNGANITASSINSTRLASGLVLSGTTSGTFSGGFSGNGSALTNLSAANLTGTLPALNGAALTNIVKTVNHSISIAPTMFNTAFMTGGVAFGTGPNGTPCVNFPDAATGDAYITVPLPDDFNFATHSFKIYYTSTTTTGNFNCSLPSRGTAPGATMGSIGGGGFTPTLTAQAVAGTLATSTADGIGQMDSNSRVLTFFIRRRGADVADTSTGVLQVQGIVIQWTTN